jgi:HK97 family phage portal protein
MGIWTRAQRAWAELRGTVDRTNPRDPILAEWFGGGGVDETAARGVAAVYACVTVLSETIGAMPVNVRRKEGDGARIDVPGHSVANLLNVAPNDWMTGPEIREYLIASTALRGDSFAELVLHPITGNVRELIPIEARRVDARRRDGKMRMVYRDGTSPRVLDPALVLRLPHKIQPDGTSLSVLTMHAETFGIAIAARQHQHSLMKNRASPGMGIKHPTKLSPEAVQQLRASWEARHGGPENAGRLAIFDGGVEPVSIGMSNKDAQFAELNQLTLRDVARIFRVQPHKIGDLENATFSNIEHQGLEFLTDTILPWVRRFEARCERSLLREDEKGTHEVELDLRGLIRADSQTRAELYRTLTSHGALSINEMRRMEGLNPVEGGEMRLVQGALVPVDTLRQIAAGDTPAEDMQQ